MQPSRAFHDQATGGEVGDVGSGNPEDIGSGAGGDFGIEDILVAGGLGATWFVNQGDAFQLASRSSLTS